jgi:hypothetical protein
MIKPKVVWTWVVKVLLVWLSTSEEPGAIVSHAGILWGGRSGNRRFHLDFFHDIVIFQSHSGCMLI